MSAIVPLLGWHMSVKAERDKKIHYSILSSLKSLVRHTKRK